MTHVLRPEDLDFIAAAPKRWTFDAEVAAPQTRVFDAISADPSTWTWFPGLRTGAYEGDGPHGVGSRRHVSMAGTAYRETMLAWDPPGRWAYRVDETSVPLARALVEDWVIEAKGDHAVVHWTFAIDPRPLFRAGLAVAPKVMGGLFRKAMANLSNELASGGTLWADRSSPK